MADEVPRPRLAAATIALLAVAAYANSFRGALLLDDAASIPEHETIRRLWPPGPLLAGSNATTAGRPLLNVSFALNRAAFGEDLAAWHAVNLVIHALAALVLFDVVRRTLASERVSPALRRASGSLAFAVAALWAVHPLQTESVTYLCQRAESLMGLLFLATLGSSIRGATSLHGKAWTGAAIASCALGMATKEVMVAAPLVVLLHDRAFLAGSFRAALRGRPGLYAGLAATWGVLALCVGTSNAHGGSAGFDAGMPVAAYASTQPRAIVEYLRLALWPDPLVLDRGARVAHGVAEILPSALAVAALAAASVWALVRRPAAGFLGAAFLLVLAPTSSILPIATQTVAEHRMYLPLAAVIAAVVVAGFFATERLRATDALRGSLVGAALAACALLTLQRNATYADPLRIWEEAVRHDPENVRAQMNLGLALAAAGDIEGAIARADLATELDPQNAYAHLLRGNLLHRGGRRDEAIAAYTAAAASPQRAPRALTSRGVVEMEAGRTDDAIRDLDRAIDLAPEFAPAYAARATAFVQQREFDLARRDVDSMRRLGHEPSPELLARLSR